MDCTDLDDDNYGIPDDWEVDYSLDPLVDDADGELDRGRFTNYEEFLEGSDPTDRNDPRPKAMPWLPLLLDGE